MLRRVHRGQIIHSSFVCNSKPLENYYRISKKYCDLSLLRTFCVRYLNTCLHARISKRTFSWNDPGKFSSTKCLKYFRMGRRTFKMVVNKLTTHLKSCHRKITSEKQVAITLAFLSSGKSCIHVAHLFDISQSDVHRTVRNVCNGIMKVLMPQYLDVLDYRNLKKCVENFELLFGIPQCVGALDNIHIPVNSKTLKENTRDYVNRDGCHSVLLQAIVDSSYKFWDVNVGWPGSVPESKVLTNSAVWRSAQQGKLFPDSRKRIHDTEVPLLVVAGRQYPLSDWLVKPFFVNGFSPEHQLNFNRRLELVHNVSRIAFKRLMSRWRCLMTGDLSDGDLPIIAASCCILHNICECFQEPVLESWSAGRQNGFQQPEPSTCSLIMGHKAESIRYALSNFLV